jgi:hypothetical protein
VEYVPAGVRVRPDFGRIVQLRIYGQQVSTEGLVVDGVYHHVADANRHYDALDPVPVEYGGSLPADLTGDYHEGMLGTLKETARRLGLRDCVLKADLCLDDNGAWWVFEAAARLSGGYFSAFQIPYSTGYDLVGAAVDLALGDVPRLPSGEHHRPIAKRSVWGPKGTIKRIAAPRSSVRVLRVVEHLHPGQESPGPGTNRGAAVTVFAVSPEAALEAARSVVVEVV